MNDLTTVVRVKEVGPRDGLQAEETILSTEDKLCLIDCLGDAGLREIETTSFVHPKAIPPLADAEDVFTNLERRSEVCYSAIVPNEKGAQRAVEAGADEIQVFLAATESYNQFNVQMSVEDSLQQTARIAEIVREADTPFVAVLSVAFGCPCEGSVDKERVLDLSERLIELGAEEITYGDTTGMAYPIQVRELAEAYRKRFPETPLRLHFHNTRGMGLANVLAALEVGVDRIDASVGGLGGSPYAPGATGNISTEDLVHMLHEMGIETGIDLEALIGCAQFLEELLERELPGQVMKAGICGHLTEDS